MQSSVFLDITPAVFCRIEPNLDSELPDFFQLLVENYLNNDVMYEKSNLQVQRWKNSPLTSWLGQDELANKISASETKRTIAYKPGYS